MDWLVATLEALSTPELKEISIIIDDIRFDQDYRRLHDLDDSQEKWFHG